jgi:hypothetical protein
MLASQLRGIYRDHSPITSLPGTQAPAVAGGVHAALWSGRPIMASAWHYAPLGSPERVVHAPLSGKTGGLANRHRF